MAIAPVPGAKNLTFAQLLGSMSLPIFAGEVSCIVALSTLDQFFLGANGGTPVITALNTVGAGTITAAGIVGKVTQRGGSQSNTAFTDTTDTAAHIIAGIPNPYVGQSFLYFYENTTNATATIAGGTGVTVSGINTVQSNSMVVFLVTLTSLSAITMVGLYQSMPTAPSGTYVALTGGGAVTVTDSRVTANSVIIFTLKTVGGTVGASPHVLTITPGTGFTVSGTASDTSTYNYLILN
jgi:hypothetical protein